jgi:type I restriction enzyme M protein
VCRIRNEMPQVTAKSRDERHRYGQHYTPGEVARLLAAFAVRSSDDLVLDPSCGDGRLLEEAMKLKRQLAAGQRLTNSTISCEVFGIERSESAAMVARRTCAGVAVADFFDIDPGASLNKSTWLPLEFDAIIGNPPYIRQEVIGPDDKRRIEARLARDRVASPELFWPRWSGRSDIYVYFFAHSIRFLKERGRLVFLTASSWLDAGYGAPLREFLLNNFRVIAVIESAAESFFADASINTSITVLERESDGHARKANPVRFVRLNRPLNAIFSAAFLHSKQTTSASSRTAQRVSDGAVALASAIERAGGSLTIDAYRIRTVLQAELVTTCRGGPRCPPQVAASVIWGGHGGPPLQAFAGTGWSKYLRADEVFFRVLDRGSSRMRRLSDLEQVRFGVKTGANEFFYVTEGAQRAKGNGQRTKGQRAEEERAKRKRRRERVSGLLALAEVASVRRGITTGANEFFYVTTVDAHEVHSPAPNPQLLTAVEDYAGEPREIESELLSPVVFSLKEIPGILLERVESHRMLFNCALAGKALSGTRALEYIKSGERAGYNQRATCASREPWYSVARGMKPAPLIFPSKVGERWVVALNRAGVFEDKKLYGIFPTDGVSDLALAALLNSTWARYYAEVTCRQMTGAQAIADIDVAVAEQIMVPDPRELSKRIKKKLEGAIVSLSRRPVGSIFEEVKRKDRRRLDSLMLEAIGFSKKPERESVLDQLYEAVTKLVGARLGKAFAR